MSVRPSSTWQYRPIIETIDRTILWKSALIQLIAVGLLSALLAVLLPKSFFEDWGWLSGPLAWLLCAYLTATVLDLPRGPAMLGAVLAGLPSIVAVVIGIHWLGALLAVVLFALWCATRLAPRGRTA